MVFILGMELGKVQLNDERYETEKNIINPNSIGVLGVHSTLRSMYSRLSPTPGNLLNFS